MAQLRADLLAAEDDRRDAEATRTREERKRHDAEEKRVENTIHKEVLFAGWERHEADVVETQKTRLGHLKKQAEDACEEARSAAEEFHKIVEINDRMDPADAAEMSLLADGPEIATEGKISTVKASAAAMVYAEAASEAAAEVALGLELRINQPDFGPSSPPHPLAGRQLNPAAVRSPGRDASERPEELRVAVPEGRGVVDLDNRGGRQALSHATVAEVENIAERIAADAIADAAERGQVSLVHSPAAGMGGGSAMTVERLMQMDVRDLLHRYKDDEVDDERNMPVPSTPTPPHCNALLTPTPTPGPNGRGVRTCF